jgi:hypothetical protein
MWNMCYKNNIGWHRKKIERQRAEGKKKSLKIKDVKSFEIVFL